MTEKRTLYLGRNSDNDHVYVEIRLERDDRPHETIYHHTAPSMVRLSITGTVIDGTRVSTKRANVMTPDQLPDHTWVTCGQCADALPRTALGDEIRELWEMFPRNNGYGSTWRAEPLPTSVLNRVCRIAGFDPSTT